MKHAYHGRTDQEIQVVADVFENRIAFQLIHWGETFDPGAVTPPTFDGTQDHGFGFFIIDQIMDEVHYTADAEGRNRIDLIKYFPAT